MKTLQGGLAVVFLIAAAQALTHAQDKPSSSDASAYSEFVEPWRTKFTKEWEAEVAKGIRSLDAAAQKLLDAERTLAKDMAVSIPNGRRLAIDRKAIATAKKALEDERAKITALDKNDPPYFASPEDKQKALFAALPPAEQARRLAAEKKQLALEQKRKQQEAADAEAKRKAEEERLAAGSRVTRQNYSKIRTGVGANFDKIQEILGPGKEISSSRDIRIMTWRNKETGAVISITFRGETAIAKSMIGD